MIYIIRHGQTNWNLEGRYAGRIDVPLNEKGIEEAYQVKEQLKNIKFDKVFSSPLIRAFQTAQIVNDTNIIKDDRLIERSNGALEGKLKSEIKEYIDFNSTNENKYNIEPIWDLRNRINSFFDEITNKEYRNKNILVVTHAGVGIYTRCYFEGEPNGNYEKYKMKNCEIIKYENK